MAVSCVDQTARDSRWMPRVMAFIYREMPSTTRDVPLDQGCKPPEISPVTRNVPSDEGYPQVPLYLIYSSNMKGSIVDTDARSFVSLPSDGQAGLNWTSAKLHRIRSMYVEKIPALLASSECILKVRTGYTCINY